MKAIEAAIEALERDRDRIDRALSAMRELLDEGAPVARMARKVKGVRPAKAVASRGARKAAATTGARRGGGKLAGREDEIRRRYIAGENVKALTSEMGCKDASIHGMAKRRGWERKASGGTVPVRRIPRGVSGRTEA